MNVFEKIEWTNFKNEWCAATLNLLLSQNKIFKYKFQTTKKNFKINGFFFLY